MLTFTNAYCGFVCMFEKYGGDPMKRSMKNQLMIQIWYNGVISNNICTPLLTWRILFGTLNPNTVRPRDTRPQAARTLQVHVFE